MDLTIKKGKYGKYIPLLQTMIDIVIVNAVFAAVALWINPASLAGHLGIGWILVNVALLPNWFLYYLTHRRKMLRSEKLLKRSINDAFVHTIIFAALITIFMIPTPGPLMLLELFAGECVLIAVAWLIELITLKRLRRKGRNRTGVVIIGTGRAARELSTKLMRDSGYGISIQGFFDTTCHPDFNGKYLGDIDQLDAFLRNDTVKEIYYASTFDDTKYINKVIKAADQNFCKIYFVPFMSPKLPYQFYMLSLNATIPAIAVHPTPLRHPLKRWGKRVFDILFSSVVLIFSPLVFIPVAIAIKISSPGPVFFKQKRTGYQGIEFDCYKFRTMKVNKDSDSVQATKDDDRKTRLGNFLRHTSIDELPQFWNVLKGDMSVVGPRPHMLAHTEEYSQLIDQYMVRHLVKPGITGWAQTQGYRGATNELWMMEKRIDCDVWYIEHWSFLLDVKIIVRTVTNALRGEENAY